MTLRTFLYRLARFLDDLSGGHGSRLGHERPSGPLSYSSSGAGGGDDGPHSRNSDLS